MLCLILLLGQADQKREEHTQSTRRAHTESNFLRASRSFAKTGLIFGSNGGLKMRSKKVLKSGSKGCPNGFQKLLKKSIKACSGGVSKRDLKNGPSPGSGKVRFCHYLLHFSKVGGLKKDTCLGTILGAFGRQNRWKQGSRTASKKVLKIDTRFTRFWVHFGDNFWVKSRSFAGRRWVWHVDP